MAGKDDGKKGRSDAGGASGDRAKAALQTLEKTLKTVAPFEEQELEPRVEEAFKASGGKILKRWIVGSEKLGAEVMFSISAANDTTTRISLPITLPMKKQAFEKISTELLVSAIQYAPGTLHISQYGRLTLTYQLQGKAEKIAEHCAEVAWYLTEGNRLVSWSRMELQRSTPDVKPFNPSKDEIWQSQMGQPVKLTAEALAMVSGGEFLKNFFVGVGKYGGIIGGGLGGGALASAGTPVTLLSVGIGLGAVAGGAAGGDFTEWIYGLKVVWCFAAGTKVRTTQGQDVAIETIVQGDTVAGFDLATNAMVETQVERLDVHSGDFAMNEVLLSDGTTLRVSNGHPFLTLNKGWLFGEELTVGDELVSASGATVIVRAVNSEAAAATTVYNVVTSAGTYLVGSAGVVCSGLTAAEARSRIQA